MECKRLIIEGWDTKYLVYEDGKVYSTIKNRFRKPAVNRFGYYMYAIQWQVHKGKTVIYKGKGFMAHGLVAMLWLPPKPTPKHELNHKDMDKRNNHWSNLEWVTHSQNMIHARAHKHWTPDMYKKRSFLVSDQTKHKMSVAKYKPVLCVDTVNNTEQNFGSIQKLIEFYGIDRRTFNRCVNSCKTRKGLLFRYL
jgi:hypothetical protein